MFGRKHDEEEENHLIAEFQDYIKQRKKDEKTRMRMMKTAPEHPEYIRRYKILHTGKKKPPTESVMKFRSFVEKECKHRCFLCDTCEDEIRKLIENAIKRGK